MGASQKGGVKRDFKFAPEFSSKSKKFSPYGRYVKAPLRNTDGAFQGEFARSKLFSETFIFGEIPKILLVSVRAPLPDLDILHTPEIFYPLRRFSGPQGFGELSEIYRGALTEKYRALPWIPCLCVSFVNNRVTSVGAPSLTIVNFRDYLCLRGFPQETPSSLGI